MSQNQNQTVLEKSTTSSHAKLLAWYIREHLGRGSQSRLSRDATSSKRTETAQYQFLSMLMNKASPFNHNQKHRLDEEFGIRLEKIRELYHDHTGKKNPEIHVSGNRNNVGSDNANSGHSSVVNENAIEYLMSELERVREQNSKLAESNQSLIDLLREKDENVNRLLAKFLNQKSEE